MDQYEAAARVLQFVDDLVLDRERGLTHNLRRRIAELLEENNRLRRTVEHLRERLEGPPS